MIIYKVSIPLIFASGDTAPPVPLDLLMGFLIADILSFLRILSLAMRSSLIPSRSLMLEMVYGR